MEHYDAFARNLCRIMDEKGLRPVDLARGAEVDQTQVSLWRKAANIPVLYNLIKIARYLDVTLEELTEGMVE